MPKEFPSDSRSISTTDPDSSATRHSGGTSKLRYKTHRSVDPKAEVITATAITPGSIDDSEMLIGMIDTVVADSKYGTIDTYLICHDLGIKAHIPSLEKTHRGSGRQK